MKHFRNFLLTFLVVLALCVPALSVSATTTTGTAYDDIITYVGLSARATQDYAGLRSEYRVDHAAVERLVKEGHTVRYGALMGISAADQNNSGKTLFNGNYDALTVDANGNLNCAAYAASAVLIYDSADASKGSGKYTYENEDGTRHFVFTTTYNENNQNKAMLQGTKLIYRAFLIVDGTVIYDDAKSTSGSFMGAVSLFDVCNVVKDDPNYAKNPAIRSVFAKCYLGTEQNTAFTYDGGALVGGIYRVGDSSYTYIAEGTEYETTGVSLTRVSPRIAFEDASNSAPNGVEYIAYKITNTGVGYETAENATLSGAAVYVRKSYIVTYKYANKEAYGTYRSMPISVQKIYPGESAKLPLLYKIPDGFDGASFADVAGCEAAAYSTAVDSDREIEAVLGKYINVSFYDYNGVTLLSKRPYLTGTDNSAPILEDGEFGCWVKRGTNYVVNLTTLTKDCELEPVKKGVEVTYDPNDPPVMEGGGETKPIVPVRIDDNYITIDAIIDGTPTSASVGYTAVQAAAEEAVLPAPDNSGTPEPRSGPTVRFLDSEGQLLKREVLSASGSDATAPFVEDIDFVGWDSEFTNVTKNIDVRATEYSRVEIEFYDDMGALLAKHVLRKGSNAGSVIDVEFYTGFNGWVDADGNDLPDLVASANRAFFMKPKPSYDFTVSASDVKLESESYQPASGTYNLLTAYYTLTATEVTATAEDYTNYFTKSGTTYVSNKTAAYDPTATYYRLTPTMCDIDDASLLHNRKTGNGTWTLTRGVVYYAYISSYASENYQYTTVIGSGEASTKNTYYYTNYEKTGDGEWTLDVGKTYYTYNGSTYTPVVGNGQTSESGVHYYSSNDTPPTVPDNAYVYSYAIADTSPIQFNTYYNQNQEGHVYIPASAATDDRSLLFLPASDIFYKNHPTAATLTVNAAVAGIYELSFEIGAEANTTHFRARNNSVSYTGFDTVGNNGSYKFNGTYYLEAAFKHKNDSAIGRTNKSQYLEMASTRQTITLYLQAGENQIDIWNGNRGTQTGIAVGDIDFRLLTGSAVANNGEMLVVEKYKTGYSSTTNANEFYCWGSSNPYGSAGLPDGNIMPEGTTVNFSEAGRYAVYAYGFVNSSAVLAEIEYKIGDQTLTGILPTHAFKVKKDYGGSNAPRAGCIGYVEVDAGGTYSFEATITKLAGETAIVGFFFSKAEDLTVTYKDGENVIKIATVPYGANTPAGPAGYTWQAPSVLTEDITLSAIYTPRVTYTNPYNSAWTDVTLLKDEGLPAETPTYANDGGTTRFYGWDVVLDEVTEDCVATPIFVPIGNAICVVDAKDSSVNNTTIFGSIADAYTAAKGYINRNEKSEVTILLGKTEYLLTETLELSGNYPITFQGAGDASVITSNRHIQVANGTLSGNKWSYTLTGNAPFFRNLYVDGKSMELARSETFVMRVDTCALATKSTYSDGTSLTVGDRILFVDPDAIAGVDFKDETVTARKVNADGKNLSETETITYYPIVHALELWVQTDWQQHCVRIVGKSPLQLKGNEDLVGLIVEQQDWYNFSGGTTGEKSDSASYYETLAGCAYWLSNNAAYLDEEGEFLYEYDSTDKTGTISALLPENADTVSYPSLETLIHLKGAKNVTFRDLRLIGTTSNFVAENGFVIGQGGYIKDYWNHGNSNRDGTYTSLKSRLEYALPNGAIYGEEVENISIVDCSFEMIGGDAVNFRGVKATPVNTVHILDSAFRDIGGSAIRVGNNGDADADYLWSISKNIFIQNNYIESTGRVYHACPAIMVLKVDTLEITHNTILDSAYSAISVGWRWGTASKTDNIKNANISYNYIEDFITKMQDGGAIYVLGGNDKKVESFDVETYWNTVSHNYIVVTNKTGGGDGHWTVLYRDGSASHWHDVGNVLVVNPDATETDHKLASYQTIESQTAYNNWTDSLYIIGYEPHPYNKKTDADPLTGGYAYEDDLLIASGSVPAYNKITDVFNYDSFADLYGTVSANTVRQTAAFAGCDSCHPTYGK